MTDALMARLGHTRQALHAHTLSFSHPADGTQFSTAAPLAEDLLELWERIERAGRPARGL
jgi:hypothetical protein